VPSRTATRPNSATIHSTATVPLPAKGGLIQKKARTTRRPSALTTEATAWPTSAVVSVAVLGAVLFCVAVMALFLIRSRRQNPGTRSELAGPTRR
jgi:hypothetical protein